MHSRGRQPDDCVSDLDARAVDQALALDDPDAGAGEVELVVLVDPGKLCGLPADECDSRLAANLRRPLDELCHLLEVDPVRGDVVEEEERIGAAREDVVDAVRGEVGAAVAQRASCAREDQLGADGVRGGGQQAGLVERMQPRERAEAGRAGGLDSRAEALDDGVARRQRDPRARVGLALGRHDPSLRLPQNANRPSLWL